MIRIIIILILVICCLSCTNKSQGIKTGLENGAKGLACHVVGKVACASMAVVDGYLEGAEKEKLEVISRKNAVYIKKMADKQAEMQGVNIKDCAFFGFLCD